MTDITTRCKNIFVLFVLLFLASAADSSAQIIVYTNDTGGVLNMIDPHATADTLKRVNGAGRLTTPCTHGFSTKSFTNDTGFSDTLKAVQVTVAPNSGYSLYVTSFSVDLRHSGTGPQSARYAYSTDGGAVWINQGTNQTPFASGTCDSMSTGIWTIPLTVAYPNHLMFRVYGFNTSVSTGTGNMQLLNLIINGTVHTPPTGIGQSYEEDTKLAVYPNPADGNSTVSYHLNGNETVTLSLFNLMGQEISVLAKKASQPEGDYTVPVTISTPGIYFIRLSAGDKTYTTKLVKL